MPQGVHEDDEIKEQLKAYQSQSQSQSVPPGLRNGQGMASGEDVPRMRGVACGKRAQRCCRCTSTRPN